MGRSNFPVSACVRVSSATCKVNCEHLQWGREHGVALVLVCMRVWHFWADMKQHSAPSCLEEAPRERRWWKLRLFRRGDSSCEQKAFCKTQTKVFRSFFGLVLFWVWWLTYMGFKLISRRNKKVWQLWRVSTTNWVNKMFLLHVQVLGRDSINSVRSRCFAQLIWAAACLQPMRSTEKSFIDTGAAL